MPSKDADDLLKTRVAIIVAAHRRARASSRESLEEMRKAGQALLELKALLKGRKGAFGKLCDAEVPFNRVWRRYLMRLAENWPEVIAAIDAQPDNAKSWSVAGALKALADAQKQPEKTPEDEITVLRRKVDQTRVRLHELEAELAAKCSLSEQLEPPIGPADDAVETPSAETVVEPEPIDQPEFIDEEFENEPVKNTEEQTEVVAAEPPQPNVVEPEPAAAEDKPTRQVKRARERAANKLAPPAIVEQRHHQAM